MKFFIPVSESVVQRVFSVLNVGAQVGLMVGFNRLQMPVQNGLRKSDKSKESAPQASRPLSPR